MPSLLLYGQAQHKKNRYCATVCSILSHMILLMDSFFGSKNPRFSTLPIAIVKMPARVKRYPANKICAAVSSDGMENSVYPILIHGNALPQRAQQSIAPSHTMMVFVINSSFISFFSFIPPKPFLISYFAAPIILHFTPKCFTAFPFIFHLFFKIH